MLSHWFEFWHWLTQTEFWDLMHDLNHIAFELTWEIITAILLWPVAKWKARRELAKHDLEHHGGPELHYQYKPIKFTGPDLNGEEQDGKEELDGGTDRSQ